MTITIEEARKLLGEDFKDKSDEEIRLLTKQIDRYCNLILDFVENHPELDFTQPAAKMTEIKINKERHLANKMPVKATLDQKIKRHIEHVSHCKCRPMPDKIKKEIEKRIGK
jgi:hypothetical protein